MHTIIILLLTLVLMSPENAVSSPWCTLFSSPFVKTNLVVLAVDEAHCIEEWLESSC